MPLLTLGVLPTLEAHTCRIFNGLTPLCWESLRHMAKELALWFPQHAQTMDAALALHLRGVGYDPLTDVVSMPQALPKDAIQGCGSLSCAPGHRVLEPAA
jgi:hypothetical protein